MLWKKLADTDQIAITRNSGCALRKRKPALASAHTFSCGCGCGAGSGVPIHQTMIAEKTKDAASSRIASGAVMVCTKIPVMPGPAISAAADVAASLELLSSNRSRVTNEGTSD